MSTKEIIVSMLDVLNEEQLNGLMLFIRGSLTPNAETIAAMEEADRLINDPDTKYYTSVDELFKDLKDEADGETDDDI